MCEEESNVQTVNPSSLSAASKYVCEYGSKDKSDKEEWVKENEKENRNIFDLFDDEEDLWIGIIISCMEGIDKSTYWWHLKKLFSCFLLKFLFNI